LPKGHKPTLIAVLFLGVATYLPSQLNAALFQQAAAHSLAQGATRKPRAADSVEYISNRYGFRFDLPESWKGYSILVSEWHGQVLGSGEPAKSERGPEIVIRHPLWTKDNPRQDIPVMIFTLRQWADNPGSKRSTHRTE
jgi:hypothetical protein